MPTQVPTLIPLPSPNPSPSPSPSPTISIPTTNITPVASGLSGAIGSRYVPGQDKLYFVEYNGNLSVLSNVSSGSPTYSVLGNGYANPEDVYITQDGNTAYITERGGDGQSNGDLVKVSLNNPNRSQATVVASGLNAPQQLAVDETHNVAYVVEFANPGSLVKIDLSNSDPSHNQTSLLSSLQQPIGLVMSSDFNTAYITEQLSDGTGRLSRFDVNSGSSTVLATSTTAPLFFLTWANTNENALLVTERDPTNKVWYIDLTQASPSLQLVASLSSTAFRPSSVAEVSLGNLFPLLVCSDGVISELTS